MINRQWGSRAFAFEPGVDPWIILERAGSAKWWAWLDFRFQLGLLTYGILERPRVAKWLSWDFVERVCTQAAPGGS